MKKLSDQDKMFLDAAEGWLGLGDHLAANEELEQITPELRAHRKVLAVNLDIYWEAKNWEAVVHIASALATLKPDNAHGWIGRSFALHELANGCWGWQINTSGSLRNETVSSFISLTG